MGDQLSYPLSSLTKTRNFSFHGAGSPAIRISLKQMQNAVTYYNEVQSATLLLDNFLETSVRVAHLAMSST